MRPKSLQRVEFQNDGPFDKKEILLATKKVLKQRKKSYLFKPYKHT